VNQKSSAVKNTQDMVYNLPTTYLFDDAGVNILCGSSVTLQNAYKQAYLPRHTGK